MLLSIRPDLQEGLAAEGYNVCVSVVFVLKNWVR